MKRSSTALLAAAGITAGLMSIALPATAAMATNGPTPSGGQTGTHTFTGGTDTGGTDRGQQTTGGTNAPSSAGSSVSSLPNLSNSTTTAGQLVTGGVSPLGSSSKQSDRKNFQNLTYTEKSVDRSKCGRTAKSCYETDGYIGDYRNNNGKKGQLEGYTPFKIFSSQPPCHTPPRKVHCKDTKTWLQNYFKPHTHFCHVVVSKCHPAPQHCKPHSKSCKHPQPGKHKHPKPHKQQCKCKSIKR